VLGCTLALAISVRATKTHDVLIVVLGIWMIWILSAPIWSGMASVSGIVPPPDWFKKANPILLVYAPYFRPGYVTVARIKRCHEFLNLDEIYGYPDLNVIQASHIDPRYPDRWVQQLSVDRRWHDDLTEKNFEHDKQVKVGEGSDWRSVTHNNWQA
jgi:hypothetical protein